MFWFDLFIATLENTLRDVFPIIAVIAGFQLLVIRRPIPKWKEVMTGFLFVILGMVFFLMGLDQALFPIGKDMARQFTSPEFLYGAKEVVSIHWTDYKWAYLFAAAIGFSATIAEPALIAVALKANELSGGTITVWGLRIAVAIGASFGITLGVYRIVSGDPLYLYIIGGYIIVIIQTFFTPKMIVPLAYDSGGVTTSTITVPIVAALGLGLASTIPGRSALLDGFGLIAFVCLFPIISVMTYAQIIVWWKKKKSLRA